MKVFIVLLPLVAGCFAGETGYSPIAQRGLLVLPKPAPSSSTSGSYDQAQGQFTTKDNYKQQPQIPEILRPEFAERRGVYFVEVPQERIQALQGYSQQQQASQLTAPRQEESFVRYLSLEASPSSQYREEQPLEAVVRYLTVPLGEEAPRYSRQEGAAVQEAVLQYSEVQPISGPVYSYSPSGLTRVLRYAPVY